MKKIVGLILVLGITFILSACTSSTVSCGPGTVPEGDTCVVAPEEDLTITVNGLGTQFLVGDTIPDFKAYFSFNDIEITDEMISHNITIDSTNKFLTAGTYLVQINIEEVSSFVTIVVTGESGNNNNNTDTGAFSLSDNAVTTFVIGDLLPDLSTFFNLENGVVDNSMIEHSIILDATNVMTTAGVFTITATSGTSTMTISIAVMDPDANYEDFVVEGVAGIYVDPSKPTTFEIGDQMPDFMSYFVAYDGANYISISPDKVLHNLLLSADVRMIQAGTYQVWVDVLINGVTQTKIVDLTVNSIGGASVDTIGSTGWEIVNPEFTDSNLFDSWFVPNGDVTVTNSNGEVDVNIHTIGMNFWDILFAQPGKVFEKGYTYEVTYRMKTGLSEGRDVVVFAESAPGAPKLLEEQVSLTTSFQDFTFTFVTETNTSTGMIGVFIGANLPGAHPGSIVFDSVVVTRTGELIPDVNLTDLENQEFTNADISEWETEGNVALTHDASGYLVADVSGFTGAFYQENIQNGGYAITSGISYTVTYTIKTDVTAGRDVTFFVEDTDAGYAKYFENTETLTTEFQTFTYTFTPTADNGDTKIGIFLGDMDNAVIGNVIIDSITITETN